MNTRTLLNFTLLAIAGLLAWVVFYEPGTAPEPASLPLTSINAERIQTIRVVHKSRQEIRLEQKQGNWFVTAPIQAPANTSMVETLLSIAKTPSHSHYPVQDMNLGNLNLEPPEAHLYLDDLALAFGTTEPLHQRRYVLVKDMVHLISGNAFQAVASGAADFVDPALLPGDYAITELRLPQVMIEAGNPKVSPKRTIVLRRTQETWSAEGANSKPASEAIAKLVKAWQQHTAQQVELKGNRATLVTIEVQREGAPPIHLELLAALPRLILARSDFGVEYHLSISAWNTLFQLPRN
ncbi:DUF4340 domain-containing protein [Nitrosococcus oceani]|uniref:DUF4340 domain-containing protein n=2 Tax=Nitrosococcus oceani TaxID=1229 RepID=Q3J7U6_NITOC|nr:DUF4340 domain-containing protein [Nitrosococcus oceani]KFI18422.1 hypothetical protein IB75_14065 [Nitrosococcus oceani C-27]ABA59100.1 conserved hypothetical protein [Nitrosococcus oceani ATCC 19707]EDZ65967.1 hypothetical protein NOC27_2647 [Nitrosococcus oceani AFC27]KFI21658.1 hypothetical protein HW44_13655 [Nitrosococcus oceani]GEM20370.1 DUF4340 domain-containing protein [Nitrosococcus oceani]